jgi:hypothetical protein
MLLRDEFLTPLRYYKRKIEADPSASLERRYAVNEFAKQRRASSPPTAGPLLPHARLSDGRRGRGAGDVASCLAVSRQRQGRRAVAPMALPRGHERLPRKYVCGVVPSIVRNISMKALTLS